MSNEEISAHSLHTGIGLIDSQHQTFFTLLKKIKKSINENSPEDISRIIEELHLYTLYHFETEEKLLEKHGLVSIEEHKEKHRLMAEQIEEFRLQEITDPISLAEHMNIFFTVWLIEHIQNTDIEDLKIVTQKN
ncbi:bacteriohemerythrin [Maridesulfovibrio zosterae]|uniref:bacteriohemerythrin n=1 Tax=Maridesulfovibrio zosterae TaxID=82171 RepID=UPI00040180DB|nr:hemerythrin family protein [Maridesulfovibrio zosterae]